MDSRPNSILCALAVLAVAAAASADIINVPVDQPTIQAGIDAAVNSDVVVVAEGEYPENIDFLGKAITVQSTDPNDPEVVANTIIDGGGSGTVVTCVSGEGPSTVLSGFTITGGGGSPQFDGTIWGGGGMQNVGSSPTVTNCSFIGNTAGPLGEVALGGGMFNLESSPTVAGTGFCDNTPDAIAGPIIDGGDNAFVCPCPDLDGDGNVGVTDLLELLADWGSPYSVTDLLALLAGWGPCP